MYNLSKISTIRITNFQSIKEAELVFDDDGIINVIGLNDTGKSSVIRAIASCLLYAYPRAHKDFIRRGTKFFQVAVTFDDGITIIYEKNKDGKDVKSVYQLVDADDKVLFSTAKRGAKGGLIYEKVNEVPEPIANYLKMGTFFINGKPASLNYGNRYDPLLLVSTSGADNAQAVNSVMRNEEMTAAYKLLNADNNQLTATINQEDYAYSQLASMYLDKAGISQVLYDQLKSFSEQVNKQEDFLEFIDSVVSNVTTVSDIVIPPEVETINTSQLEDIVSTEELVNKLNSIRVPPKVDAITGVDTFEQINDAIGNLNKLEAIRVPPEVITINADSINTIREAGANLQHLGKLDKAIAEVESKSEKLNSERDSFISALESKGYIITVCENCGELSVVDSTGKSVVEAKTH